MTLSSYAKPHHIGKFALPDAALGDLTAQELYDLQAEVLEAESDLLDTYLRPQVGGVPIRQERLSTDGVSHVGTGPSVTVSGTPDEHRDFIILVTAGGARGTATFNWSKNAGASWDGTGITVPVGGTYVLGTTGITATFPAGTYVQWETYLFDTNGIPPALKRAVCVMAAYDMLAGRGFDPNNGTDAIIVRRYEQTMAWAKEIAKAQAQLKQTETSDLDGDGVADDLPMAGCVASRPRRGWGE